ncbi:hypothetical protein [Pseudomonas sp. Ps21-P2]|uniref:hypothetical protein n=1 Tax=Pseudomonas sp. Ps21-P2 TaxID=3080331 RepID=UPI00320AF192
MKSNIVEVAGGSFIVTGISYATGIAYYNAFFRSMNGNPDLFTVSPERVLFEGGRQLLYIAFNPILMFVGAVVALTMLHILLSVFGFTWIGDKYRWVKASTFGQMISATSWAYLFLFMAIVTSYAFSSGKAAGEKYGSQAVCVRSQIVLDKNTVTGCILYKTEAEVWLSTSEQGKSVLLNIPTDKYSSIRVY